MSPRIKILIVALTAVAVAGLVAWGVSSGGGAVDAGAGNPQSAAPDYEKALADAPPALARLYANGDQLIAGGADQLHSQLAALDGHPAVVNVWASWCGPCRLEFPAFQEISAERGDEVAFIGVDADDTDPAARGFLDELPLPYPSVTDPDQQLKSELHLRGYPATAFYDSGGKLTFLKQGPYTSTAQLEADIDKYAM
jgi:cytochrome c biogenesis protein CcmG/thiol:disulfide interchange protein DsbE